MEPIKEKVNENQYVHSKTHNETLNSNKKGNSNTVSSNMPINSEKSDINNQELMYNNYINKSQATQLYTEDIVNSFGEFGPNTINSTEQYQALNNYKPMYQTHYIENTQVHNPGEKVAVHRLPDVIVDPNDPRRVAYRRDSSVSPSNANNNSKSNSVSNKRVPKNNNNSNSQNAPRVTYRLEKLPDVIVDPNDPTIGAVPPLTSSPFLLVFLLSWLSLVILGTMKRPKHHPEPFSIYRITLKSMVILAY